MHRTMISQSVGTCGMQELGAGSGEEGQRSKIGHKKFSVKWPLAMSRNQYPSQIPASEPWEGDRGAVCISFLSRI